jgi:hypothetical protein
MSRLIGFVTLLLCSQALAADISVLVEGTPERPAVIFIQGVFKADGYLSDANTFAIVSSNQKHNAIVFLDSPGGNVSTAIWIGQRIREREFSTAVDDNTKCMSACALVWMGGKERYLGAKAHLGFHSTRANLNKSDPRYNHPYEAGNAIVAKYLQNLGVREENTALLLAAPPNSIMWVTVESLAIYGVSASYLSSPSQIVWPVARKRQRVDPTLSSFRG